MRRILTACLILIISFMYGDVCDAQKAEVCSRGVAFNSWLAQETATGQWGGFRNDLEDRGLNISCNYTTDIGGNPSGGLKQVTKYSGFLSVGTVFDLEKIASIKGLSLVVSNYLASGSDLAGAIGSFYSPQEIYTSGDYFFGELELTLALMEDSLILEAGRLFAGDVFGVSPYFQYYLSTGINGRLAIIPSNIFLPSFNITSWGVRTTYQPVKDWHVIAGLYDADKRMAKLNNHGARFSFDMDKGYLAIGEMVYGHKQTPEESGYPGSVTIGSYYESSKFQDLSISTKMRRGNYGFYAIVNQMLYKKEWPSFAGPDSMRAGASMATQLRQAYHGGCATSQDLPVGLSAWFAAALAPQDSINLQTYQMAAGLVYQGLPPNRNRDVTAFCVITGNFSDKLDGQGMETVLELNHRIQAGPWFYITPDIQYIIHPDGRTDIDDALVLGFEASVDF